jgi:valyl-tRNA synthetase
MTARAGLPERPSLDGLEDKWARRWQEEGTYTFDRSKERPDVYAIDTPPPTVSGELHMGHVFSYTHTDLVARFQRMRGKTVFYPMGWDDNGLPTERRVQNVYGVRCDPALPYDPDWQPPAKPKDAVSISRRNFVELCDRLTARTRRRSRRCGASSGCPSTGDSATPRSGPVPGPSRSAPSSTTWRAARRTRPRRRPCGTSASAPRSPRPSWRTGSAPGAYHKLRFHGPDGPVEIDTTRPELLPACVALVFHPGDERYQHLVGKTVRTPFFAVEVPVHEHPLAARDKGTGIAMVCTFGDLTDVTWWRDLQLETRVVLGRDGRFLPDRPAGVPAAAYEPFAGLTVNAGPARDRPAAARGGRPHRRADADHASGEVLREGRLAARDRHEPAVVHPQRRPRARAARAHAGPGPGAALVPGAHAPPVRALDQRPDRGLADQPSALLRRARPGVVPARQRWRTGLRPASHTGRISTAG